MPTQNRILILGGGISGLLAAWHLRRPDREIEVWEASDAVGGWAQTLPWPGPNQEPGWLERGPQGLRFAQGSALQALIHELRLPLYPTRPKGDEWLGRDGHRFSSPMTLRGLFQAPGLSPMARLRFLLEPFISAGKDPQESLHGFMTRRFGESFAREWLPALVAGVFAAPPTRIGMEALPALRQLEAQGGLLLGSLRASHPRTRQPVGGTGALAQHLATRLGCVRLNHPGRSIAFLPDGRWRIQSDDASVDVDELVLALPPQACATLLRPTLPSAAHRYESLPMLDLSIWHSRHASVPGWERGFNLLLHPPDGKGLLGIIGQPAADPRGVPGLLQVRSFLGGAYAMDPALEAWPGVAAELHRWLPELSDAIQVREASCPSAFPLLEPDHGARIAAVLAALPPKLHWIGAARFGPGVADLAEGIQTWAETGPISSIPVPEPMAS